MTNKHMKECSMSLVMIRAFLLHVLGCCWHEHVGESGEKSRETGSCRCYLEGLWAPVTKGLESRARGLLGPCCRSHLEELGMDTRTPILSEAALHGLCHLAALLGCVEGAPLAKALLATGTGWRRSSSPTARAVPQGLPHDCTHRVIWIGI